MSADPPGSFSEIAFPAAGDPLVSVIVRVSATAETVKRCMSALLDGLADVAADITVVDDGADPDVGRALSGIQGLRGFEKAGDAGARRALNAAAAASSAPFICFLDDAAQIAPDCLPAMLAVMRAQPACGAVGVKLLSPDGRVRQAGGVAWRDGSRCSYGLGEAEDAPHCNYLREVDYCSGAVLMVRRDAIRGRDAFDDAWHGVDSAEVGLAFDLRRRGWKVFYGPRAVAVHHGPAWRQGDLTDGARSAMLGEAAFLARWRGTLERRHFAPCQCMFRAREHARDRRVLLVVDHYVPQPDRDAGSRAIHQTMLELQAMGFVVKFWPENQDYTPGYRALLEDAGIEVVAGERWGNRFERYVRYAGSELDVVLLSRPDVASGVIDLVKAHSAARVLFYGHDLHHRRMALRAEVTRDDDELAAAERMRDLEESLWDQVDAVIYPSTEEADVAAGHVGAGRAHPVPLYVFADDEFDARREPVDDVRLLFVAGFGHSPNIDAAQWLVGEILPRVRERLPNVSLDLVGSNPTASVLDLARTPGVHVSGSVSADVLETYYRRATLAVVPLRFGAGVKLKVLEAMVRGVPVVTTPVGAQGLPGVEACIQVAEDVEALARAIVAIAADPRSAAASVVQARAYVRRQYAPGAMRKALWRTLVEA